MALSKLYNASHMAGSSKLSIMRYGLAILFLVFTALAPQTSSSAQQPPQSLTIQEAQFSLEAGHDFPTIDSPTGLTHTSLPHFWDASTRPTPTGHAWYRLQFTLPLQDTTVAESTPLAALIPEMCEYAEAYLNGHKIYSSQHQSPQTRIRNCYKSQLIPLPAVLLRSNQSNTLDLSIQGHPLHQVTTRQHAGHLSEVHIGPLSTLSLIRDRQVFWDVGLPNTQAYILLITTLFALLFAWVRHSFFAFVYTIMSLAWACVSARVWIASTIAAQTRWIEPLSAFFIVPATTFTAIALLIRYRDHISHGMRIFIYLLLAQIPLLLLVLFLTPQQHLFFTSQTIDLICMVEMITAYLIWRHNSLKLKKSHTTLMSVIFGLAMCIAILQILIQLGWLNLNILEITRTALPVLLVIIGLRLLQILLQTLQAQENIRASLEHQTHALQEDLEHSYEQRAEQHAQKIAEQERKRIAGDLHDDLGAKLLTIVHVSDNDHISTIAREALEEMRLSVKGLTGKPVALPDAIGDWRAETVMRLTQAGIHVEWQGDVDDTDHKLNARTYVQISRIFRESTNNIIKHSEASQCHVTAEIQQDDLILIIRDNGKGISQRQPDNIDQGHGMTSMKRRAKQIGGQCLIESAPGRGTVIRFSLPI